MMWTTLFVLLIGAPLVLHEGVRLRECAYLCRQRQRENENFIGSSACSRGSWDSYGEHAQEACKRAFTENAVGILECAAKRFWRESAPYHLIATLGHSYWSLLGLVLPCLLYVIRSIFAYWEQRRAEDRMERMYEQTLSTFKERELPLRKRLQEEHDYLTPLEPPREILEIQASQGRQPIQLVHGHPFRGNSGK